MRTSLQTVLQGIGIVESSLWLWLTQWNNSTYSCP